MLTTFGGNRYVEYLIYGLNESVIIMPMSEPSQIKSSKEPTWYLFKQMWHFSEGDKGKVVFFLFLFVCSNLVALVTPLIFGRFLNEIQAQGVTADNLTYIVLLLTAIIGATLVFWIFHGIGRVIERNNAFRVKLRHREYLLQGVLNLGLDWHNAHESGDTIDKVNKAITGLHHFSDRIFLVMEVIIRIIGTAVVLYFFNPVIGLATIPFILLAFLVLFQFDRRLVAQYKQLNEFDNKISAKIFDALSNVTSIVILNVVNPVLVSLRRVTVAPTSLAFKNHRLNEWKWFTGSVMFDSLVAIPLIFYIIYSFKMGHVVEVGTVSALYLYLERLSVVFFSFGGFYEEIIVDKAAVENAQSIEQSFQTKNNQKINFPAWNTLIFTNLTFSYEDTFASKNHIQIDSFNIKRGERIAIIGESGSGKTTFLKLLHGLYETAVADVAVDGKNSMAKKLSECEFDTMLVPQEPELFSATVRENITFGVDYEEGAIERAVRIAQFTDVVSGLPKGLESNVNEKGVNLSGGQKQRLALARALLFAKNKSMILLDESTSSVDPLNEALIYEGILKEFEGKTIIASIHKMNLLKYFSRIVLFDNGTVADQGSFEELLSRNKHFADTWKKYIKSAPSVTKV